MLAETIGSRPIGTPENARARQYIVDQLRVYGFEVRVQETDARRPDIGLTARVANIVAVKAGQDPAPSLSSPITIRRPTRPGLRTMASESPYRWKRHACLEPPPSVIPFSFW